MPKTLKEIIDHADELAQQFEDYEPVPGDERPVAPLQRARAAVRTRAQAESDLLQAVSDMRGVGYSWAAISSVLGTTAEAARQRYRRLATGTDDVKRATAGGAAIEPAPAQSHLAANAARSALTTCRPGPAARPRLWR